MGNFNVPHFAGIEKIFALNSKRYQQLICDTLKTDPDSEEYWEAVILINTHIPIANCTARVRALLLHNIHQTNK